MTDRFANPLRVLVVDDERTIADSLAQIFRLEGHDVRTANSGEEAFTALSLFEPHVMVADVVMGAMDGVQLALLAGEVLPRCSVILFSGQADTSEVLARLEGSGRSFQLFPKPVAPRVLLDVLRTESERRNYDARADRRPPHQERASVSVLRQGRA